jgi:hypothetical protein
MYDMCMRGVEWAPKEASTLMLHFGEYLKIFAQVVRHSRLANGYMSEKDLASGILNTCQAPLTPPMVHELPRSSCHVVRTGQAYPYTPNPVVLTGSQLQLFCI